MNGLQRWAASAAATRGAAADHGRQDRLRPVLDPHVQLSDLGHVDAFAARRGERVADESLRAVSMPDTRLESWATTPAAAGCCIEVRRSL